MIQDRKAMVGFPIRIAVAFLILSISVPVMIYAVGDLNEEADTEITNVDADRVADAISEAYYAGCGSIRLVTVSIDPACHIMIGGPGSEAYSIGIFVNDIEKDRVFLQRPPVKIIGDGLPVSGDCTLKIECVDSTEGYGVEVSVFD